MIFDSSKKKSTEKAKFTSREHMLESNPGNKKDCNGMFPCLCEIPYPTKEIDYKKEPKIKNLCAACGGKLQ